MKIIPAIDLIRGKAAHLISGKTGTERFMVDPFNSAERFQAKDIETMHIVDLDAAKGLGNNTEIIKQLIKSIKIKKQVGGGIRTLEKARELISLGADKLIIGTKAVQDPNFILELEKEIGKERIIVSFDSNNRKIMMGENDELTNLDPIDTAKRLQDHCGAFLLMCIDKEGTMQGLDIEYIKRFAEEVRTPVIASGGVGSLEDIKKLKESGVYAVVIGTALYIGNFKLEEAVEVARQ